MRGISPVISFVLIVAVLVMSTTAIYFWIIGSATGPAVAETNVDIEVHPVNSTILRVTNIGVSNSSSLASLNTTAGDCTFPAATVLRPGIPEDCELTAALNGSLRVWATGVNEAVVYA